MVGFLHDKGGSGTKCEKSLVFDLETNGCKRQICCYEGAEEENGVKGKGEEARSDVCGIAFN